MKKKILYVVLGILIGATITAGIFLLIGKENTNSGMNGGQRPSFENFDGENMPENMPSDLNDKAENTISNSIAENSVS